MMSIRACIFDLDGVILESNAVKGEAFYRLFRPHGLVFAKSVREHHLQNGGMSRYQKFAYHYERLGLAYTPAVEHQLDQLFSQIVVKKVLRARYIPGAKRFLRAAAAQFPIAVASATPEHELRFILDKRGLAPLFSQIKGSPLAKAENLRHIAETWQLDPAEILFFGDSPHDYLASQEAGTRFYALGFSGSLPIQIQQQNLYAKDFQNLSISDLISLYE